MYQKSFYQNWILFQDKKYNIYDFIRVYENEENDQINSVINFIKNWQSDIPYITQKTSGSTGAPKIINITKSQINASALATLETLAIKAGDHAFLCINADFIGGKMMIARTLIGGLNLSIAPAIGNPLKDFIAHEPVDFFSFVPYQIERILDESPDKIRLLNNSKAIILGGAPVSEILEGKIKSKLLKTKVYSTYGMTETVSHVALKLINSDKKEAFKALKNIEFSVDQRNCLVIHAPEISGHDKIVTNDVVKLISSTEFHWMGRSDFVINSGGIKIHPELLEKEISILFDKATVNNNFFIFGLADEKLGESLNLMIEGKCDTENILDLLKQNLTAFRTPKKIFTIEKFVHTDNGKINRFKTIENVEKQK